MKKLLLLIALMLSACLAFAIVSEYTVAQSTQAYTEITGGTIVASGTIDDTQYLLTPPFAFSFNEAAVSQMSMSSNGYISFNAGTNSFGYGAISSSTGGTGVVTPLSIDLQGRTDGEMRWEVFGTAPNRYAVYQWKNWRAYGTAYANDNWNFQVILYETTNQIAFRYGSFIWVSAYANSAQVGIRGTTNADFRNLESSTNWSATTPGATNTAAVAISPTVYPPNGLQFLFLPPTAGSAPNPAINVSPMDGAGSVSVAANLIWASGGGLPTGYKVYFGTDGGGTTTPTSILNGFNAGNVNSYDVPNMDFYTTYYWQIVPYNAFGDATGNQIWTFTTGGPTIIMTNGSLTLNPGDAYNFYDSGGPTGNYLDNENYTFTFNAPANYAVKSNFSSFVTEGGFDYLHIYNGPTITDPLLGTYNGSVPIPQFISTHPTGALTFRYTSDGSVTYAGWEAVIDLQNLAGPPNTALPLSPLNGAVLVSTGASLNWASGGGAPTGYDLYFGTTNPPTFIGDLGNVTTWTPPTMLNDTIYYWKVVPYNAFGDAVGSAVWSFTTAPEGLVGIGSGTDITPMLPINAYYGYTYSQSIYLASEIGAPGLITSVSYYWNGAATNPTSNAWVVYMGHTPNAAFASVTDWLPYGSLTQVFSGAVDIAAVAGWVTINLTTPFAYNGTQNLVIAVEENADNYDYPYGQFYCTTTPDVRSLLYYSDGFNPDPVTPPEASYLRNAIPNVLLTINPVPTGPVLAPILVSPTDGEPGLAYAGFPFVFNWNSGGSLPDTYNLYLASMDDLPEPFTADDFFAVATSYENVNSPFTPAFSYVHGNRYVWTVSGSNAVYPDEVFTWPPFEFVIEEEAIPSALVLQGTVVGPDVSLSWMNWNGPTTAPGWVSWNDGSQNDSIGTGGAAEFSVAQKFPTTILSMYNGDQLTKVKFFPAVDGATYNIRLWTGTNDDLAPVSQVYDQAVTTYTAGVWNEVILTTPYPITNTDALYIGYYVNTTTGYPAGCDAGPQVSGLGNLIQWAGTWTELTGLNATLTYNWCIQGYVTSTVRNVSLGTPQISIPVINKPANLQTLRNNGFTTASGTTATYTRALQGYNVYRNNVLLNTGGYITGNTYLDVDPGMGIHTYQVEAIYVTDTVMSNVITLEVNPIVPYTLPFVEEWDSSSYLTQDWATSTTNWMIDTGNGQPIPSAGFSWSPRALNYESYLTAHLLEGAGHSNIWLSFQMALNNYDTLAENWIAVEVWDGTVWNTVNTWSSFENGGAGWGWTYYAFDITTYAAGHDFKVRFKATGVDSYSINYWYLDNINVYQMPTTLDTPVVNATYNGSNVVLDWMEIPGAIWYGIYGADDPYGTYTFMGLVPGSVNAIGIGANNMGFFKVTAGAGALPAPPIRGQLLTPNPIESIINK